MWNASSTSYEQILQEFKDRFNSNPRAKKLVNGWDRLIFLESSDVGSKLGLVIKDQTLVEVQRLESNPAGADDVVHLLAEEDVLVEIFSGRCNPATALVDGVLAVYSKERDKVKLEALAMILWRLG